MRWGRVAMVFLLAACAPSGASSSTSASPPSLAAASPSAARTAPLPAGAVRFVATPFKGLATVRVEEHLAVNLVNTDAVLTSNGVDGLLTLTADGTFTPDSQVV